MAQDYNSTINLPKTDFEMRAGLPKKEPVMLKDWEDNEKFKAMLADKIFHEMTRQNMNARTLAQRTGISDKMISNYLWAKQMPSAINCMKIADALDIDMNELFNFF